MLSTGKKNTHTTKSHGVLLLMFAKLRCHLGCQKGVWLLCSEHSEPFSTTTRIQLLSDWSLTSAAQILSTEAGAGNTFERSRCRSLCMCVSVGKNHRALKVCACEKRTIRYHGNTRLLLPPSTSSHDPATPFQILNPGRTKERRSFHCRMVSCLTHTVIAKDPACFSTCVGKLH